MYLKVECFLGFGDLIVVKLGLVMVCLGIKINFLKLVCFNVFFFNIFLVLCKGV